MNLGQLIDPDWVADGTPDRATWRGPLAVPQAAAPPRFLRGVNYLAVLKALSEASAPVYTSAIAARVPQISTSLASAHLASIVKRQHATRTGHCRAWAYEITAAGRQFLQDQTPR